MPSGPNPCNSFDELLLPQHMTLITPGVLLEVILVVLLGRPERTGLNNLGDDGVLEITASIDLGLDLLGCLSLRLGEVEDRRTVLGADVVVLTVAGGRVVQPEKIVQNLVVGHSGGVEDQPDALGVPGPACGHLAVGRVLGVASGVADLGGEHAIEVKKEVLDAPKTPGSENGLLGAGA